MMQTEYLVIYESVEDFCCRKFNKEINAAIKEGWQIIAMTEQVPNVGYSRLRAHLVKYKQETK